jgi:restriction endonuclease S subunit
LWGIDGDFELSIGKRIVKKDIVKFSGNIPIYSANVFKPVGFSDKSNITNFDNNFVLWGIDGDFEFNAIPKNTPFISTDHCGVIRILSDNILPKYLMIQLENVKHIYGFDRGLRASLKNMSKVKISIPIDENGNIDIEKQKEVIDRYNAVQEIKKRVKEYREKIKEIRVEIKEDYKFKYIEIKDIFKILGEENLTKTFIENNKGKYPVYSAQITGEGVFGYINKYKYNETILTWVTYGDAGKINIRTGKFNIGRNNCGLRPKNKNINLIYAKFISEPLFIINAKGNKQKSLPQSIAKKIKIPIPIKPNGEFYLEAQKEIANKYKKIEDIKKIIEIELKKIEETKIDYE